MGGVVYWLQDMLSLGSPILEVVLLIATGVAVYGAAVAVLETQLEWGLRRTLGNFMGAI